VGGPARFWKAYRPEFIVAQDSDQGPWGGKRWYYWESSNGSTFSASAAASFAESKGWKCIATRNYSAEAISTWVFTRKPVFPLPYEEHGLTRNAGCLDFPRKIAVASTVIQCESGWTRVYPGHADAETAYGYIQVSVDGKQMAVYHLWGET
jgi:hypothetical protein